MDLEYFKGSKNSGKLEKVLVVEDDASIRDIYTELLGKKYEILGAGSISEAKEFIKKKEVCCAILDLKVSSECGLDLVDFFNGPWCIIVSGYLDAEKIAKANKVGIFNFIQKPADFDLLEYLVDRVVARVRYEKAVHVTLKNWKKELGD